MKQRRDLRGLLEALDYGKKRPTGNTQQERDIHKQAMEALNSLISPQDTAFVDPLIAKLKTTHVRGWVLSLLGKIGGEKSVDLLIAWLQQRSDSDVTYAALALAETRDPRAAPALIESLRSKMARKEYPDGVVRALGKLGDSQSVEILREALKQTAGIEKQRYFHNQTREALKLLGGFTETSEERLQRFVETLNRFIAGNEHGFELAKEAAELGSLAIPELERRLERGGEQARTAAIALAGLSPDMALPLVERAFQELFYPAVRSNAAEYLVTHPSEAGKRLARQLLESESHEPARRILEAALRNT